MLAPLEEKVIAEPGPTSKEGYLDNGVFPHEPVTEDASQREYAPALLTEHPNKLKPKYDKPQGEPHNLGQQRHAEEPPSRSSMTCCTFAVTSA